MLVIYVVFLYGFSIVIIGLIQQQRSQGCLRSDAEGDGDRPELREGHGETGQAVPEMQQPNVEERAWLGRGRSWGRFSD